MSALTRDTFRTVARIDGEGVSPRLRAAAAFANILTIDLEDWAVAVLGPSMPLTERVVANTDRLLDILARHEQRATFFVLGRVAQAFPELIRRVAAAGHEIASHGFGHDLLPNLTPERFRADVARSADLLNRITGSRPIGYRAPAFSIGEQTRWAGPILAELGFRYSSSVFPIAGRRYGIPDAPLGVHRWPNCDLVEVPPSAMRLLGRNWPVAGGGYFRLLPGYAARSALRRINAEGRPAVVYMHPYEIDVNEIDELRAGGWRVPAWRGWTQSLFRSRVEPRLECLLREFRFVPVCEALESELRADPEVAAPRNAAAISA